MSFETMRESHGSTCRVDRPTETATKGAVSLTWTTIHTDELMFIQIYSGIEAVRYGRENNRRFGKAYARVDLDVLPKDRIVALDGHESGKTFDIQSVVARGRDHLGHLIIEIEQTD